MPVYVDQLNLHKNGYWCHMVADTSEELETMAVAIGLKLEWIQVSSSGIIHYDLRKSKRILAVKLGAIECTAQRLIEVGRKSLEWS